MGSFGGIGVRIVNAGDEVVIVETIPGTPAEKAGLYPGDRIIRASGVDLMGLGVDRAVELLRGPQGTTVTISVVRPGADEVMDLTLERDDIKLETVTSRMLQPGLGYIKISSFDRNTGFDFAEHFERMQGDLQKGLILDLRNNTGGLIDEAIRCSTAGPRRRDYPPGRSARSDQENSLLQCCCPSFPAVVLVNEESASASEIVAGALQDREAAAGRRRNLRQGHGAAPGAAFRQ